MNKNNQELAALLRLALSIPKIIWDVGERWVMVLFDGYMLAMREDEALGKKYFDMRKKDGG